MNIIWLGHASFRLESGGKVLLMAAIRSPRSTFALSLLALYDLVQIDYDPPEIYQHIECAVYKHRHDENRQWRNQSDHVFMLIHALAPLYSKISEW